MVLAVCLLQVLFILWLSAFLSEAGNLACWGWCQLEDFKLCFWSPQLLPERPVDLLGKLESHQAHSPARSVEGALIRKADMGRDPPHLSAHEADFAIRANESRDEW